MKRRIRPKDGRRPYYGYVPDEMKTVHEVIGERIDKPTPELRLAAAVMGETEIDLHSDNPFIHQRARDFVLADGCEVYSFRHLCDHLRLDVDATRARLLKILPGSVRPLGFGGARNAVTQRSGPTVSDTNHRRRGWWRHNDASRHGSRSA